MGNEIRTRAEALRAEMKKRGIDAYLIPTADFHDSEYVGEYFKCRRYMTGFTGSAGTAVITMTEAGLWTDGRYFVQAESELEGSGVTLYRMGQEGVPSVSEFLQDRLPLQGRLGFDGRVVSVTMADGLRRDLGRKQISFSCQEDLVGKIWTDRPALSAEPVWLMDVKYAGRSAGEKLADLRAEMKKCGAGAHVLTTLDDIAWLLNIRGNDILCTPVVLSYLIVTADECRLFIQEKTLSQEVRDYLSGLGVRVLPYDSVYEDVKTLKDTAVLLERARVSEALYENLDPSVRVIDRMNPTSHAKAVKNPVEMENMRCANLKDSAAITRFMYWVKHTVGKRPISEVEAADHMLELRRELDHFIEPSFESISAYGTNAAMCHYQASPEKYSMLEPKGLYLLDSGGHYLEGTTDVTRTIALGPLTDEEKECYTMVACSMLHLLYAKFIYGCRGVNLDYLTRELMWRKGIDYNHGTGHGVGYVGVVHERPNSIRWKVLPDQAPYTILEEGMVTSDEPGLYFEGKFGIRTENLTMCVKAEKNEYGQFMRFDSLTFVPIDLDAIDVRYMEPRDRELLNDYHRQVFEKVAPLLPAEEAKWLKQATRAI